jgi:signal transduction histidine kinase
MQNAVMTTAAALPQLPKWVLIGVGIACALPFVIDIIGWQITTTSVTSYSYFIAGLAPVDPVSVQGGLSAGAIHTILEWTACCVALLVALLALFHYSFSHDLTMPIIGMALFCSGSLDAFHVLAANGYIQGASNSRDFIAFTWTIGRAFNAVIITMGAAIFLDKHASSQFWEKEGGLRTILIMSMTFGVISFAVIYYCANAVLLPPIFFPDARVPRPWDALPLILYLIAGMMICPRFYRRHPTLFAHALMVSTVPHMVAQIHAAYGSVDVFDRYAHYASFLKVVAYAVPLIGLLLDYRGTYKAAEQQAEALARSNLELEQFAYVASHDLQEPLRKIINYAELFEKRYKDSLDESAGKFLYYMVDGAQRMRQLIQDLLTYSRLGRAEVPHEVVDLQAVMEVVKQDLEACIRENGAKLTVGKMPTVWANTRQMQQLLMNLVSNALKYRKLDVAPDVQVTAQQQGLNWVVSVQDNGIGISPKYYDKIFVMFQRLHGKGSPYEGTGIGLALCKKIVDQYQGRIWVESEEGNGARFYFTVPALG